VVSGQSTLPNVPSTALRTGLPDHPDSYRRERVQPLTAAELERQERTCAVCDGTLADGYRYLCAVCHADSAAIAAEVDRLIVGLRAERLARGTERTLDW